MTKLERKEMIVSHKKYVIDEEVRLAGNYTFPLKLKIKTLNRYYNLSMKYKYFFK